MKKKLISAAIGTGMIFATAIPAFATDTTCTNDTTGAKSINTCNRLLKKKVGLHLSNSAYVKQKADVTADTGYNESNKNTVGGEVTTDPADASSAQTNDVNTNIVGVDQTGPDGEVTGLNTLTGYKSTNSIDIKTKKKAYVHIDNDATVKQYATVTANTGNNESNKNTVGGVIETGEATASSTQDTIVNWNEVTITQ